LNRAVLVVLLAALGCGTPPHPRYVRDMEAAAALQRQGKYDLAAAVYERAASYASTPRDAAEAHYRAADSYERAGSLLMATKLYTELAAAGPDAERSARAEFALADVLRRSGREVEAEAQLERALRRAPSSGMAQTALRHRVDYVREHEGSERALAYLAELGTKLAGSELEETIVYLRARELDRPGGASEARDAYLACATRFPYPGGVYWDDALFRAAEKELELGAPERAISHLERMLAEQERSSIVGSYERGRYAEASLKIGEIYRDVLHDSRRAREALLRVWQKHPKSRLVDDALFQAALLAHRDGDAAATCESLSILVRERPDSRYAACAKLLCKTITSPAGDCHEYIKRSAGLGG
jgi:TolA-binding protein